MAFRKLVFIAIILAAISSAASVAALYKIHTMEGMVKMQEQYRIALWRMDASSKSESE